jgi:hypothetical protein
MALNVCSAPRMITGGQTVKLNYFKQSKVCSKGVEPEIRQGQFTWSGIFHYTLDISNPPDRHRAFLPSQ